MNLLAADLRALANLPATASGRRVVMAMAIGLGLLATMSWWIAHSVLLSPRALQLLARETDESPTRALLGYGLMTCPVVATWLGLAMAQRQLFETPELMLWRQAPIRGWAGPVQVFLRALLVSALWSSALAGPFVVGLLQQSPAPWWAYLLVPLAILACTAPLQASLLAAQIVMVRFLSGRWLRLLLSSIAALASVAFTVWLLLQVFTNGRERIQDIAAVAEDARDLPLSVHAAAVMLDAAIGRTLGWQHVQPVLTWLLGSLLVFGLAAGLHARAHERFLDADRPLWRRSSRRLPVTVAGNVRQKELAQVLQQPGALIGFLVFAVLVYALAREQVLVGSILSHSRMPAELRRLAAMLTWWFLAVLLVLYAHMGRLALWDGAQWPLYMASPARPGAILRGKLQAIALFLCWPMLLVGVAGVQFLAADARTLACYVALAGSGTLVALGVAAVVGTWPRLMRPDAEGQILQGSKSFLAAMVMVTLFQLAMLPAILGWHWLVRFAHDHVLRLDDAVQWMPALLAVILPYGLLLALLGWWIGGRNYRRLLEPR